MMNIIHFKTYYSMTDPRNAQHAQHFLISSPLRRYTVPFNKQTNGQKDKWFLKKRPIIKVINLDY